MKKFAYYWGLDFVGNQSAKKVLRLLRDVALVAASASPVAAPFLAVLGVAPSPTAGAVAAALAVIVEAVRNEVKHNDRP